MKPHCCFRNGQWVASDVTLHGYIADMDRRRALASARMATAIETATAGEVPKEALRPDIWPPADAQQQEVA